MAHVKILASAVLAGFVGVLAYSAGAQQIGGAGSTVQGDILRGEGIFLQGAAWYDLNEAKAMAINVETAKKVADWNRQVYEAYMRDREAQLARRRYATERQEEQAKRARKEREQRLRTNPTMEDIVRADALNALLIDLANPSISESSWRFAKIALPAELSIRSLIFRFAPRAGDNKANALARGLIALGRLDLEGKWPTYLQGEKLEPERKAVEAAYRTIRQESLDGKLTVETITELDDAINNLKKKISVAVPTARGFQVAAHRFVEDLKNATGMFDAATVDFAREMISDTQRHEAHTVGELLAFMRKYRLLFASAESVPAASELYGKLYGFMREQKEKLQLKSASVATSESSPSKMKEPEAPQVNPWPQALTENGQRLAIEGRLVAMSRDSRRMALLLPTNSVRIVEPPDGTKAVEIDTGKQYFWRAAFSPDGKLLACTTNDGRVTIYDAASGDELRRLAGDGLTLAFSPDGKRLASAGGGIKRPIRVWDTSTGATVATVGPHSNWVWCLAFSPDGKRLASGSGQGNGQKDGSFAGELRLWDLETGDGATLEGHAARINGVAFSPDGKWLASASHDKTVKVWDLERMTCMSTFTNHQTIVGAVAFSPDGRLIASVGRDEPVHVWSPETGREVASLPGLVGNPREDWQIQFSPDGRWLFSSKETTLKTWRR